MEQSRSKINASRYFIKEAALIKQNTFYTIFGGRWGEQSCCVLFVCFVCLLPAFELNILSRYFNTTWHANLEIILLISFMCIIIFLISGFSHRGKFKYEVPPPHTHTHTHTHTHF